jgi:microcystin-dependent protein
LFGTFIQQQFKIQTMSDPFISEIKIMSFSFAPHGWALCNGQTLPINQNQALFALLGTTYGGNGQTTFLLPNLQGRTPVHMGAGITLGQQAGEQNHTLAITEIPTHTHDFRAVTPGTANTNNPNNALLSNTTPAQLYVSTPNAPATTLRPQAISTVGGSQGHNNMQPYLTLSFCIALQGIFPSQN